MNLIKKTSLLLVLVFIVLLKMNINTIILANEDKTVTESVYSILDIQLYQNRDYIFDISLGDIIIENTPNGKIKITYGSGISKEIEDTQNIIITGTTVSNAVTVDCDMLINIIMQDLFIDISEEDSKKFSSAFDVSTNSKVNIIIKGNNYLKTSGFNPALKVQSSTNYRATASIDGDGYLEAVGGSHAAGIGGRGTSSCGNLWINGGKIKAIGGKYASGIGAWRDNRTSNIIINAGMIEAIGGENSNSDIGGEDNYTNDIYINGGSIKSNRILNSPPIDNLNRSLYLNTIDLKPESKNIEVIYNVDNAGEIKTYTDNEGKLYLYLPEIDSHNIIMKSNDTRKDYKVTIENNNIKIIEIPWDVDDEIVKKTPKVILTTSSDNIVYGDTVKFTTQIISLEKNQIPTGQVIFKVGESILDIVEIENGIANCNWTNKSVSNYDITAQYSGDDNYNSVQSNNLNINVNKKELNVICENTLKKYGQKNPEFKITFEGFINNENDNNAVDFKMPYIYCSANSTSDIGQYDIEAKGGFSKNYSFNYIKGILKIEKTNIQDFILENKFTQYNGMYQKFYEDSYKIEGIDKVEYIYRDKHNNVVIQYPKDVGVYEVTLKFDVNKNYKDIPDKIALLIINKAPLKVIAKDYSIIYGMEPNNSGVIYNGFVNNEDKNMLGGILKYNYNYIQNQDINDSVFEIQPSGLISNNYNIEFICGKLYVNKAIPSIEVNDMSVTYDGKEHSIMPKVIGAKSYKVMYSLYDTNKFTYNIPINVGKYNVKVITSDKNYIETTSNAILIIKNNQDYIFENEEIDKKVNYNSDDDYEYVYQNEIQQKSIISFEENNDNKNIKKDLTEIEKEFMFDDIKNHWARKDIIFVALRNLFLGIQKRIFNPDGNMTRGMFVTVLGRLYCEQNELENIQLNFNDINPHSYYAKYVAWAYKNKIVNGVGNKNFAPDRYITREEMAMIFVNFINFLDIDFLFDKNSNIKFKDENDISMWAKNSVEIIYKLGIINGKNRNMFLPRENATRAEVATMFRRFIEKYNL